MTTQSKFIGASIALASFLVISGVSAVAPTPMEPESSSPPIPVDSVLTAPGLITANQATTAQFYGQWEASLAKKDPLSGNLVNIKGTVQYKNKNTFSSQVEVKISGIKANVPFSLTYKLWTKGTWNIKNNVLTETTTDIKSIPTLIQNGQQIINIAALPLDRQTKVIASLPNMDAIFPKNVPETSKIIKVSANELTINSDGEVLVLTRVSTK